MSEHSIPMSAPPCIDLTAIPELGPASADGINGGDDNSTSFRTYKSSKSISSRSTLTKSTKGSYRSRRSRRSHRSSSSRHSSSSNSRIKQYVRRHKTQIASLLLSFTLCIPVLIISDYLDSNKNNIRNIRDDVNEISRVANVLTGTTQTQKTQKSDPSSATRELEGDDDNDNQFDIPQESQIEGGTTTLSTPEPLKPYTIQNVLQTLPYFHYTFSVLVYDPPTDKFIAHYSNNMRWISGCKKLITSFKILAHTLRALYPERFTPNQPEFALAISSADYPGVEYTDCIKAQRNDCIEAELSPILHFGSVFQSPSIFSSLMAMPMPQMNHLSCYHFYALTSQVCEYYMERGPNNPNGLILPETLGLSFDELIPQVVWRGTDFSYLHKMYPELRQPNFDMDIASQIDLSERVDRKTSATHAMRQVYNSLIPRWKGVVWSAEAERDAERRVAHRNRARNIRARKQNVSKQQLQREEQEDNGPPILPWCNIKFAGAMYMGVKTHTSEIEYYRQFEEHGIPAIGEGMSLETLGQYKYHIDLGGGGGTTWSGTLEKLGLPGLLFHHVTPTKDYFHDKLQPFVHYVPVKADLSDLKEKYDWAESHPQMAKRISDNATQFIRWLGTPEGMDEMFHQFYSWPLQQVVEAYQPLEEGQDWRNVMDQMMGGVEETVLRPILQCGGYHHHDCERLVYDIKFTVHDRGGDAGYEGIQ